MQNTFADNLNRGISEFTALVFEAVTAHETGDRMNVQRALDYAESKGVSSEWTPKPPSNAVILEEK